MKGTKTLEEEVKSLSKLTLPNECRDKKDSKTIGLTLYVGQSFVNAHPKDWKQELNKSLNTVALRFYKKFNISFLVDFVAWDESDSFLDYSSKVIIDGEQEYNDVKQKLMQDSKRDSTTIKKFIDIVEQDKQVKTAISKFLSCVELERKVSDLRIIHKVVRKQNDEKQLIFGLTGLKQPYLLGEMKGVAVENGNYGVIGKCESTRQLVQRLQHEISHCFGAEDSNGSRFSVMDYSFCNFISRWDYKNAKLIKEGIKKRFNLSQTIY